MPLTRYESAERKQLKKNTTEGQKKFSPSYELPDFSISKVGNIFFINKSSESVLTLHNKFGFGRYLDEYLILSPYEVFFLSLLKGDIGLPYTTQELWRTFCEFCGPSIFPAHYAVYHHYRCNFWIVRDGTLFGSDFVLYCDHQELVHSSYMVSIVDEWSQIHELSRTLSRIAWSVNKTVILVRVSIPDDANIESHECIQSFQIEAISLKRIKFNS